MKNILNVSKISLKPIFMSLAILFTAGVSLPNHFEKVASASYPSNLIPNKYPYGISEEKYNVPKLPQEYNGRPIVNVVVKKFPNNVVLLYGSHDDGKTFLLNTAPPKQKIKTD